MVNKMHQLTVRKLAHAALLKDSANEFCTVVDVWQQHVVPSADTKFNHFNIQCMTGKQRCCLQIRFLRFPREISKLLLYTEG